MNTSPSLYEQCLELAKQNQQDCPCNANERLVEALEAAIAEQALQTLVDEGQKLGLYDRAKPQEPVGFIDLSLIPAAKKNGVPSLMMALEQYDGDYSPLYTHPQTLEPMSEEEIEVIFQSVADSDEEVHIRFARAIEAHHNIGLKK